MNNIIISGNLGADAERINVNEVFYLSFSVGVNSRTKQQDGSYRDNTDWVQCLMRSNSDHLLMYLKKGTQVIVSGAYSLRCYSSAKDHCWKAGLSIMVDRLDLVGGKRQDVPPIITTQGGLVIRTMPFYRVEDIKNPLIVMPAGNVVTSQQGQQYFIDGNGWVTAVNNQTTPSQQEPSQQEPSQQTPAQEPPLIF